MIGRAIGFLLVWVGFCWSFRCFSCGIIYAEPVALRYVWNAIEVIRGQRQIANISRITKIIQKDHSYTSKEILHHIHKAVKDNMVVETISIGCKGSKAGMEQEGYWIPEDLRILDVEATHDWYCFKCHKPGELVKCAACVVAFHPECIEDACKPNPDANNKNAYYCKYCEIKHAVSNGSSAADREELNKCLGFVAQRALETTPELEMQPNANDYTHYNYFIKEHQNLNCIIEACKENKFEVVSEFVQKTEVILHNCVILLGEKHSLTDSAKRMLEMCSRELTEFSLCKQCYLESNLKASANWFCRPCTPPHRVLWAKQRGFGYWPAKVIQIGSRKVDVRFFGAHHERAWVGFDNIESIAMSPVDLNIKKSKSWLKANDEMKEYIRQAEMKFGSTDAAQVVVFDYWQEKPMKGPAKKQCTTKNYSTPDAELNILKQREMKRRQELSQIVKSKKRWLRIKESRAAPSLAVACPSAQDAVLDVTTVNEEKEQVGRKERSMSAFQVKTFGQKAKLNAECARTWPYGTELIVSGLFRMGYKLGPGKKQQEKVVPVKVDACCQTNERVISLASNDTEDKAIDPKCDCGKRYEAILLRYKACARRMRNEERSRILSTTAHIIGRKLEEEEGKRHELELEIKRLKRDNEVLQEKLSNV